MKKKTVIFIVFGIALLVLGLSASNQSGWVTTEAIVTMATVFEGHGERSHAVFTPFYIDAEIEYQSPQGSHKFMVHDMQTGLSDRKSAEEAAQKLQGSKVPIKYDPKNPSKWLKMWI